VCVRLFVAAWPPERVVARLDALDRPPLAGLRWTKSEHQHVTLEFLGDVAETAVGSLSTALETWAKRIAPARALVGPSTELLGNRVLCLPVRGLDEVAAGIRTVTTGLGFVRDERAFTGHLTLARTRGRQRIPAGLTGEAVSADWLVDEIRLVASFFSPEGPRYEPVTPIRMG
jgi:RNA 2',3'-cyclic 3'-phosphodiesterase